MRRISGAQGSRKVVRGSGFVVPRTTNHQPLFWNPDIPPSARPVYRAIADAMAADIGAGRLGAGARLPSQRALAGALGVNLTTVTRAMREAERRGLVIGSRGSGTFVASRVDQVPDWPDPFRRPAAADFVDLSLNYPPDVAEAELAGALAEWVAAIARRPQECRGLLPYRATQGSAGDRAAAAAWLEEGGLATDPDRIVICSGAQHGLGLGLAALARPGAKVLCEALAYPGLRAVARTAGLKLIPVAMDQDGMRPAALRDAIRQHTPAGLVSNPTFHNPTGVVMPLARRQELARLLRQTGLWVIEDDIYGALANAPPRSFAALLPERTVYVTSLSKTVAPGLRIGYLVAPDAAVLGGLLGAARASSWMAAPILASIASSWIREGVARRAVRQVRAELARRQRIARQALGSAAASGGDPRSPHLWIPLADASEEARVVSLLNQQGVGVTAGEAFRIGATPSYGFRLGLGAARSQAVLNGALAIVADALEHGDVARGRMVL